MPFFKYKNKSCYYEEHGEGIPLLFLHGNTASLNMFLDVMESFSKDYKVVLIDFPGHGFTCEGTLKLAEKLYNGNINDFEVR
ncbi:AB hydrolase superfamily protein YdjP [Pelotomaculum schinkii]|uniref:AB hydrolase superfamily protein YdjP n=1 Tax=Pelotomaculum schinkii TaxID=78350 RepID=A0A4Y7RHB3_9FIRM|nr:alpha/beta fold hydrolase [Pelotomaculum schinkii]TEB08398.1 AB hydrolase superfamily protein YdjP [Pelotomaculum schinkii]